MKKTIQTASLILALLAMAACSSNSAGTKSADTSNKLDTSANGASRAWNKGGAVQIPEPGKADGKGIRIGYTGFGQDNPYTQAMAKYIQDEASRYGAESTFLGPPTFDPTIQSKILCDAATSKTYQAMIILPIDSASVAPCVKQLVEAGVKVATVQFPAGPDVTADKPQIAGLTTQIREDVLLNARTIGEGVVKGCEGIDPCQVEVLWGVRSLSFDAVKPAAFRKVIASHSNIKVVCETDANYTENDGRSQAADCLSAHPKLNVIASAADESIKGAESSIRAAGRTFGLGSDDIKLVGAYASHYGVKQVAAGKWLQTYFARPESDSRAAVDLLLAALQGKDVPQDVLTSDLDDVGVVVDAGALKSHPGLKGQW